MRDFIKDPDYSKMMFGRFSSPWQCHVRSETEQCTERALYKIENDTSRPYLVCTKCLGESVTRALLNKFEVVVRKLYD